VAWEAGMDPGFYVIDIDGTLVNSHSPGLGTGSLGANSVPPAPMGALDA